MEHDTRGVRDVCPIKWQLQMFSLKQHTRRKTHIIMGTSKGELERGTTTTRGKIGSIVQKWHWIMRNPVGSLLWVLHPFYVHPLFAVYILYWQLYRLSKKGYNPCHYYLCSFSVECVHSSSPGWSMYSFHYHRSSFCCFEWKISYYYITKHSTKVKNNIIVATSSWQEKDL